MSGLVSGQTTDARASAPRVDWSAVRSVLLVRLRSIGDTVLMTPCLTALKAWQPGLVIGVVLEPAFAPLLEDHPAVDKMFVVEKTIGSRLGAMRSCRRFGFDLAYNIHGGPTAAFITAFCGARFSIGFRDYRYSWLLNRRVESPDGVLGRDRIHTVEQQLALLAWSGVPWPAPKPRLTLGLSPDSLETVRNRLRKAGMTGRFAVIAPAAAIESKRWPAAAYADIIDHLGDYWRIPSLVVAARDQQSVVDEVVSTSRSNPVALTDLSLKELVALISLADLFVGNDSGPVHIAAALDRPIVAIFGSSNPEVWSPWTDAPVRVLRPADAGATHSTGPIKQIPVHLAIKAADEVIEAAVSA